MNVFCLHKAIVVSWLLLNTFQSYAFEISIDKKTILIGELCHLSFETKESVDTDSLYWAQKLKNFEIRSLQHIDQKIDITFTSWESDTFYIQLTHPNNPNIKSNQLKLVVQEPFVNINQGIKPIKDIKSTGLNIVQIILWLFILALIFYFIGRIRKMKTKQLGITSNRVLSKNPISLALSDLNNIEKAEIWKENAPLFYRQIISVLKNFILNTHKDANNENWIQFAKMSCKNQRMRNEITALHQKANSFIYGDKSISASQHKHFLTVVQEFLESHLTLEDKLYDKF